jgi:hypothetical protein
MIKPTTISYKFYVFVLYKTTHENNSLVKKKKNVKINKINGKKRSENKILVKL